MVDPEILRQFFAFPRRKEGQLAGGQLAQICLEILQKQLVVPSGKQFQNMVVVLLQMLQQVQEHRLRGIAIENMPVRLFVVGGVEDMAEQLRA